MSLVDNKSWALVPYVKHTSALEQLGLYMQENLKTRIQNVLDDSFKTQFRDYTHFHHYGMGDIVVLVGTSTAGKTSIIQALKQLESDRLEDGVDLRDSAINLMLIAKYNPTELEILLRAMKTPLDVSKASFSLERQWKLGVSENEKLEAEEALLRMTKTGESFSAEEKKAISRFFENRELQMLDDAFEHSRKGRNVILDMLQIDILAKHVLMRNFDGPLRIVLTYCPFHVLSSRMEQRNKEAIESGALSNQRIGAFPLQQFSEIYTQKENRQVGFERLTRSQVTHAFNENFDKGIEANRETAQANELSLEKEKSLASFLANLGFKEGIEEVEVAPRMQQFYHLFINSNELHPTASAKIIHDGTNQRY